jgi:branched-chain amino acid transport system permease protein
MTVQTLVDAFAIGAVYALIAVGIGLVFGVLRLVNFAYGQLIMAGAYALALTNDMNPAASIAVCFGVVVALSLAMDVAVFRWLRNASAARMLVATFAISFLLQNGALLQYSYRQQGGLGDPVGTLARLNQAVTIGSLHIRWVTFLAIGVALVSLAGLALLLGRTTLGLQMRAASLDFPTARLLGVRANTVIVTAVAVSGVLAAVSAVVLTIQAPLVTNTTGLNETIVVLVGVVVGGIDRLASATLGGFAIGFATSFLGFELATQGSQDQNAWPFTSGVYLPSVIYLAVIAVLLLRPAGLFARQGQAAVERV